jgi:nucleoid DNA-binding protein
MSVTFTKLAERLALALNNQEDPVVLPTLSQEQASIMSRLIMDIIIDALASGEDVSLDGFGRLYPDIKPPKKVHSGITRKNYEIGYRVLVKFNAFSKLNSRVKNLVRWAVLPEENNDDS